MGLEHAPWLEQDISTEGVKILTGLFTATDPGANLNPRKIVADATKATSGPGTTKKPVAAKAAAAKTAAAKGAPKKAAPRTKARATAS